MRMTSRFKQIAPKLSVGGSKIMVQESQSRTR
jgi:hypothetical protein